MARRSRILGAYASALALSAPVVSPLLLRWRLARGKELAARLQERRGRPTEPRAEGELIWIHAASVGELISMLPIVDAMVERGLETLVTTGTVTSARLAEARLPPGAFHQFVPLDVPRFVRRFLDHWRPSLAVFAESELWPNLMGAVAERNTPIILANARMSERSFRRWSRARGVIRVMLERVDLVLAQSRADAERLAALGAPRVQTTGNLKFDVPAPPAPADLLAPLQRAALGRRVLIAASTHAGEEAVVARVHAELRDHAGNLLTILAPRNPDRRDEVARLAATQGLNVALRSETEVPAPDTDIFIVDTIGELGLFYRLADIAFLGGSLVPHGGQNPIEPAKLGVPILHGPHIGNFAEVYQELDLAQGALQVDGEEALTIAMGGLSNDEEAREMMRQAAGEVVIGFGGALARTLAAIDPYLMQLRLGRG